MHIGSSASKTWVVVLLPIDCRFITIYSESLEQRRTQRYRLQLPLHIIHLGDQRVDRVEQTRDISSGGVCFLSPSPVGVGGRIEYVVTLSGNAQPVRIRCLGKVLRSRQPSDSSEGSFEVAVTMERYEFVRMDDTPSMLTL
jgi:hypothetical protein